MEDESFNEAFLNRERCDYASDWIYIFQTVIFPRHPFADKGDEEVLQEHNLCTR